ncbi:MAG: alpha/beta hydrolase [Ilumatobacteraceae bacterium]
MSVLFAVATLNALWPVRRPWWVKMSSFTAGWFANELPIHLLAGHAVVVATLCGLGALDERPGQVGVALSVAAAVGLVVLAAAHRRAGEAMDEALGPVLAAGGARSEDREGARSAVPTTWLAWPWLAWTGTPEVERIPGIVYSTVAGRSLELDLHRPARLLRDCPVLVEIHGGGWIAGDRRLEARPLMHHMAERGWVCVSIDYRVGRAATWPEQLVDVNSALAWVHEHIAEYGGDPDFVAVTGGSAGGHLAALAALAPDEVGEVDDLDGPGVDEPARAGRGAVIRACVPFYGPYDFDNSLGMHPPGEMRLVERFVVRVPLDDDPVRYARASPLARVHADAPAFLVVQGSSDNLVFPAESRAFVDKLRTTSRAAVAYAEIPRAQHEFDAVASVRTCHVIAGVRRFLEHVLAEHRRTAAASTAAAADPSR